MSWTTFILFFSISFASMYACYRLGQQSIILRYEEYARREREKKLRASEFEELDED